jgi:hypothetical protein
MFLCKCGNAFADVLQHNCHNQVGGAESNVAFGLPPETDTKASSVVRVVHNGVFVSMIYIVPELVVDFAEVYNMMFSNFVASVYLHCLRHPENPELTFQEMNYSQ